MCKVDCNYVTFNARCLMIIIVVDDRTRGLITSLQKVVRVWYTHISDTKGGCLFSSHVNHNKYLNNVKMIITCWLIVKKKYRTTIKREEEHLVCVLLHFFLFATLV